MPNIRTDKHSSHRLFIRSNLLQGAVYLCDKKQANYLQNVLRMKASDTLAVFNGIDGEWLAQIEPDGKKKYDLVITSKIKNQSAGPKIHYLFAPLKRARLDYMVQKATEMGVAQLQPVLTSRTGVACINEKRMAANIVEAVEQCGILRLPELLPTLRLEHLLTDWNEKVPLIFCDECAVVKSPIEALGKIKPGIPVALLIGPEGGFDSNERQMLTNLPFVHAISLGPRIMRADTAAIAALALLNAVLFDWQ